MAPPYSNGFQAFRNPRRDIDSTSLLDDCLTLVAYSSRWLWKFWRESGRRTIYGFLIRRLRDLRRNLTMRRLLSFPHLLVAVWVVVLLWGERWVFHTRVEDCHWSSWENWPPGANPHHLILVADPQLIDPHSYPGRPWPLSSLTVLVTDNYLRRSYNQLQKQLRPDTVFFLGDLFDGGREWKTAHGEFTDPKWSRRPDREQKHAKSWRKRYGEDFWLREYARFGDIFIKPWLPVAASPGSGQRGRKLIASLPGNHDLGFGSEVKVAVRNRFETYFGDANRVDVIGNHTFVSVDTVSLSAESSDQVSSVDLRPIYQPTEDFLYHLPGTKRKAVAKELRFQRGEIEEVKFNHRIEDLERADFKDQPTLDPGEGAAELPTILLTHVPLYRPPGTPCGPLREHWPPTRPAKGQRDPVFPDHRNAISVARGYQYQNVLGEADSAKIIKSVGNVVHAFSGDDHDYCEITHSPSQGNVREITVKSISMAMGVATPGFLMVSMYNPIDAGGKPLSGSDKATLRTHLCLLPSQLSTYSTYGGVVLFCLVLLAIRAFLVPVLNLSRFALDPLPADNAILPVFKAKVEDYDEYGSPSAGFSASRFLSPSSKTRGRSQSFIPAGKLNGQAVNIPPKTGKSRHSKGPGKWGWGESRGPKIEIKNDDDFYDGDKWKAAPRSRSTFNVVLRELWATAWRVAWMVVLFWFYLAWKG